MVNLKDFASPNRWWGFIWGGGHTAATDPQNQGWRASLCVKGGSVLLVGRKGVKGCATVVQLSDNRIDVALYEESTPEEIATASTPDRVALDPVYIQLEMYPGWGLTLLEKLRALQ